MSFRCEKCGVHQEPRTRPNRVVVGTRPKIYAAHRDGEGRAEDMPGWEIAREINACATCSIEVIVEQMAKHQGSLVSIVPTYGGATA